LGAQPEPEILTLTERFGFVAQRDRFSKRLAIEDTSNYKLIGRYDLAFNPYLLWAGAIALNTSWDRAIISPLYPTFHVRSGYYPQFVNYILQSNAIRALYDTISFGSVPRKRRATVADFLDLHMPKPPSLPKQKRIAEILDGANTLRVKRRLTLDQLDILAKVIFLDTFGDPATNSKRWPMATIGDLLDSASYGTSQKSESTGKFPVLRMNNITRSGEMDLTDLKYMDLEEDQHDRYLVKTGDLLFNRTNSPELVGKTAIFNDTRPMAYAGYLIRLRVNKDNKPEYLASFLNSEYSKHLLRRMCKSIIGMANINATELQSIKIPKPPFSAQRTFANQLLAIEKLKAVERSSLEEQDNFFEALKYGAFRGEL
jgi:type I restriction enzyme S subunit